MSGGVNHYIQEHLYTGEQNLIEDLLIEAIQFAGINVYYIPRESATNLTDFLFGEDVLSKFTEAYPIEMYVERTDGFDGSGEMMSKFGLSINNQIEFSCSIRRFREATSSQFDRPREGDLIYFRLKPALFEIKYVADKVEFYQLHKLYMYRLTTEIFKYGEESIETGVDEIDDLQDDFGYQINLQLLAGGAGNYQDGETITIGTATAKVISWDNINYLLRIRDMYGTPAANTAVVGGISGATYTLVSYDDLVDLGQPESLNDNIRDEANTILDFTESNPFSESTP
jgi:hypothetical protein